MPAPRSVQSGRPAVVRRRGRSGPSAASTEAKVRPGHSPGQRPGSRAATSVLLFTPRSPGVAHRFGTLRCNRSPDLQSPPATRRRSKEALRGVSSTSSARPMRASLHWWLQTCVPSGRSRQSPPATSTRSKEALRGERSTSSARPMRASLHWWLQTCVPSGRSNQSPPATSRRSKEALRGGLTGGVAAVPFGDLAPRPGYWRAALRAAQDRSDEMVAERSISVGGGGSVEPCATLTAGSCHPTTCNGW